MKDKNGIEIKIGDSVQVPKPNKTDIHNFEFVGTVADWFESNGIVLVIDQENDFFEIEAERLEVVED